MVKSINKNIYRGLLIITFLVINVLVIMSISKILSYFKTGADRSAMLHVEVKNEDVYLPKVKWKSLANPGRPMEKQTQYEIQQDYLDAWYVRNIAYKTNDSFGLQDFYTDNSRKKLLKYINDNKKKGIAIENTTLTHHPELDFYSADGQLIVFTDHQVEQYRRVYKDKKLAIEALDTANYKVLMLLEDGFWRIRHMIREPLQKQADSIEVNAFAKVKEGKIYVNNKPFEIQGINYYPQKSPWDMFGDDFDEEIIAQDFKIIKEAQLNSIRIFIQYEDFGKAVLVEEKLQKLKKVLDIAFEQELKVVITLFDFYGDYSVLDWTLTHRHVEQIVSRFKNHEAILAWDIKNEPDLDFKNRGEKNVLAWLEMTMTQLKKYDPNHLITIGWATAEAAALLKDKVDFISFHYYLQLNDFDQHYRKLKIATNKPLVMQEYGLSSNRGLWSPFGITEEKQAKYHQVMQEKIKRYNLQFMSWTLYDFDNVPSSVVGSLPWRKHKQKHFGFLDHNGNKKPAFKYIAKQ